MNKFTIELSKRCHREWKDLEPIEGESSEVKYCNECGHDVQRITDEAGLDHAIAEAKCVYVEIADRPIIFGQPQHGLRYKPSKFDVKIDTKILERGSDEPGKDPEPKR